MNGPVSEILSDMLDLLTALARDGARPEEARVRLRSLQEDHPACAPELVWQEEPYDNSVHYDALLRLPDAGTISLAFCPDRALPWPLRGVQRANERTLVRVNATRLSVDQAVAYLDFVWDEARLVDRLVNACLIREELNRAWVEPTDAELHAAMDAFRRSQGLYRAVDTRRWLERRGLTEQQLVNLVTDQAAVRALRRRVTAGRVEAYYDAHRTQFDIARIARIDELDAGRANELAARIRAGDTDFLTAAQAHFLNAAGGGPEPSPTFAVLVRGEAPKELAEAVFATAPGTTVGPIASDTGRGFVVAQVLSFAPARLDASTRRAIEQRLFAEWLEERRADARIEWNWGDANRLGQPT